MDVERVKKMAAIYHDKKLTFEQMGYQATRYDLEERKQQTIDYEVARSEMVEAKEHLRIAQGL
ncbi:hypothetical protein KAR91_36270 [Candidatus Pacearchaeota archaeon]|nr:hypothetical protein [Candidatus Pacearchaeota archaeon]